jgi:DNA-binding NarL/FixJ family response regulator
MMVPQAPTVLLCDDHIATRAGARLVLEAHGFRVVAEVSTADAAVTEALASEPHVCLVADHLPGGVLWAIKRIAHDVPATKIAMLTTSESPAELLDALLAGADGYVLKAMDPDRLPAIARALLAGEVVVPRSLTSFLVSNLRRAERVRTLALANESVELTNRELEVLSLLHDGMTTSAMAIQMRISPITVRRHISKSVQKLGESDRDGLLKRLAGTGPGGAEIGGRAKRRVMAQG